MGRKNVRPRIAKLIGIGLITGIVISSVDNFAFGGEVSPIVIVILLLLTSTAFGAFFGWPGSIVILFTWVFIPLVHLVKHLFNLHDTINPNTFESILKLAIFTFVVASVGFGSGILLNRFIKDIVKKS